jgi:hypothetical protein
MARFEEFSEHESSSKTHFKHNQLRRAGIIIMFLTAMAYLFFLYVTLVSWWQPTLSNRFIDALRTNNYYILLPPVLIPTVTMFTIMNWLGMQFFKRN